MKAGMQECGTARGTEVTWFHEGNYTEMMQEVTINGSFPEQPILKKHLRSRDVFPLEPVYLFALTEVIYIAKRNSQLLPM